MTLATGLLFGRVLPAMRVSRVPLNAVFAGATGAPSADAGDGWTRSVVLQFAVSLFLVHGRASSPARSRS